MTSPNNDTAANTHITEYLQYYLGLPESPNFAVMLDGAWGIGKTYLIKKFLNDLIKSSSDYIYVSLYGLTSAEQIADEIFRQRYPITDTKGAKLIGAAAKAAAKYARISTDLKISDLTKPDTTKLYVFDDLERTVMQHKEALGYINELVEHNGCKVVVIANEKEVRDQDGKESEEYRKIKEKLIGKTLVVQSSFNDAFEHFIQKIPNHETQNFFRKQRYEIRKIYQCANIDNLRILQQTMWDFDRFYMSLSAGHLKAETALLLLFQQFCAYSFDYKAGRISEKDLKQDTNAYSYMFDRNDEKELSPIEETIKRYKQTIRIEDRILSPEILTAAIAHGLFDHNKINTHLSQHPYFKDHGEEKPWVTLWHFLERTDEQFEAALASVERQLENYELLVIGEIYHVVGLKLWMAKKGLIDSSIEETISTCKKYIDDLLQRKKLEPMPLDDFRDPFSRHSGWGGLGIMDCNSTEYIELFEYIQDKRREAQELSYEEMADALLEEMKESASLFSRRINSETEDSKYYNTPILEVIPAEKFVDEVLSLPVAARPSIFYALKGRHECRPPSRKLPNELIWLDEVKEALRKRLNGSPRLLKYQISIHINDIENILKNYRAAEDSQDE